MWLYLITIVAAILGLAAAIGGLGPIGIILIVGAIAMLAGRVFVGSRHGGTNPGTATGATGGTLSSTGGRTTGEDEGPQDTHHVDEAHVRTGVAHEGQANMVPGQERAG